MYYIFCIFDQLSCEYGSPSISAAIAIVIQKKHQILYLE